MFSSYTICWIGSRPRVLVLLQLTSPRHCCHVGSHAGNKFLRRLVGRGLDQTEQVNPEWP